MNGQQAQPLELETWMQDVHEFSGELGRGAVREGRTRRLWLRPLPAPARRHAPSPYA